MLMNETKMNPGGRVSWIVTFVAMHGPAFVTLSV
jgi:hypothetical protein